MIIASQIEEARKALKKLNQEENEGVDKIGREKADTKHLWAGKVSELQQKQQKAMYEYEEQERKYRDKIAKRRKP